MQSYFDCIVIGGGHAGIEAALASSRMGIKTLMLTLSFDTIGQMSCNPAIGGVGKGQLVKEIDALGGEMGKAADKTAVQFRQLNASKGAAVRSSRCQSDRSRYRLYIQGVLKKQERLTLLADKVIEILVKDGQVSGVKTEEGHEINTKTVIATLGTFLRGRMHIGKDIIPGGRRGEPASIRLADNLEDLGFEILNFKTGTPPRLDGRSIDFSGIENQDSDDPPMPFSFATHKIPKKQKLLSCYITYTNERTHDIIRQNFHMSPMYSGQIQATGVRYCPSIEDKLKKFPDKIRHQVFLEPEGIDTYEYYPNGISTGLPTDVQEKMVRTIKGLEEARIIRPGYSIEHGIIPPTNLTTFLETKRIKGLFFAGQINGTTGYEEAASQGLVAGINAALKVKNREPFILGRHEAYIGVLIDDLVTKGTNEPYRMFTSRVEYRLIVREDNADKRLMKYGYDLGLINEHDYGQVVKKYKAIEREIQHLREMHVDPGSDLDSILTQYNSSPLRNTTSLSDILKRPGITYEMISPFDGNLKGFPKKIIEQVEYEIKYEGYIKRQLKNVERFKHIESIKIPNDLDFNQVSGLSFEIRQKLTQFCPQTLGQANRISGVTPVAISILMVYLRKRSLRKKGAGDE